MADHQTDRIGQVGGGGGRRRRRRRRAEGVGAVVALALLVASCGGGDGEAGSAAGPTSDDGATTTTAPPPPTTGPVPTTTTTTTTSPPMVDLGGAAIGRFADLAYLIPAGWHQDAWRGGRMVCVQPDVVYRESSYQGCTGLIIARTGGVGGEIATMTPEDMSYLVGTGMDCPFLGPDGSVEGPLLAVDALDPVDEGFRPVGDLTARWTRWSAHCEGGPRHPVQTWLLPVSQVAFVAPYSQPQIEGILDTVSG